MDKSKMCHIRDLYRALHDFESAFADSFGLGINEAMLLCTLNEEGRLTSSELATRLGLTPSNTSKVIRMVEGEKWVRRIIDKDDRRKMIFTLTEAGRNKINQVKCTDIDIPALLEKTPAESTQP